MTRHDSRSFYAIVQSFMNIYGRLKRYADTIAAMPLTAM